MSIQCTICMSSLSVNEGANAATCGHVFHELCLAQWFVRSKTCPQCRARCDERNNRRLYFSPALNSSIVDADSLQVDVENLNLEIRTLKSELEGKKTEIKSMRDKQEKTKSELIYLQNGLQLAKNQLQRVNLEMTNITSELDLLRTVEKDLKEQLEQKNNLEFIKNVIESDAVVSEVQKMLEQKPDIQKLMNLVCLYKREVTKAKRNSFEAANNRRVCQDENKKLRKRIKELMENINELESDNYKLKDDLSQMKRNNEPNTSNSEASSSSPSSSSLPISATPAAAVVRSITTSSIATPKTESPYLNIRQSNVGLTPLLNRKRGPDAEVLTSSLSNLSIFNKRQKLTISSVQGSSRSSLIHNGFGGSERKENFVGFPKGYSKSNLSGRNLSKSGLVKK